MKRYKIISTSLMLTHALQGFGQSPSNDSQFSFSPNTSSTKIESFQEPSNNFTSAQILPAYKLGLKKGMFELASGIGHIDGSNGALGGQSNNIKTNPQTDFIPYQISYAFTDNLYFSIGGRSIQERDKETRASFEGAVEPQFNLSYLFRNYNSGLLFSGTYSPDMGPREIQFNGISRVEGNAYSGGASGELLLGYFYRLEYLILGGEGSYLYKDTRTINESTISYGRTLSPTQTRVEGGAEKMVRGTIELAAPFRVGGFIGRTWIELAERQIMYQPAPIFDNSHYKNFYGAYARFQVASKFSILPIISFNNRPDTSGLTSGSQQDITTQVNLRYRF